MIYELTETEGQALIEYEAEIKKLLESEEVPPPEKKKSCSKCAYFEYCYI